MRKPLKVGDKVRLKTNKPASWESKSWCKAAGLKVGQVYTVTQTNKFGFKVKEGKDYYLASGHFAKCRKQK